MAAASQNAVERELEPEEEEQEDDPDLGHEARNLGRLDQAQDLGLVRPEEQSREEVGGNRGKSEAARDEAEHAEDGDCDGEVAELHPLVGHPDATASMLEGRIERRAHDRVSS